LITQSVDNAFAKNIENQIMLARVTAKCRRCFFETQWVTSLFGVVFR